MFLFRLAKELGKTVGELIDDLSPGELDYWIAYYSIEPFGERRADLRSGIQAAVAWNTQLVDGEPRSASDFMLEFPLPLAQEEPQELDPAELADRIKAAFGAVARGFDGGNTWPAASAQSPSTSTPALPNL